jgi:hypothetical protein
LSKVTNPTIMDDEDQAPSHFRIDPPTVPCPELGTTLPNLWFVLSPVLQEIRPIYKSGLEFCPLCQVRHRVFYCCDCVSKGEFTHSNPRKPGDLAEKRNHFKTLDDHRRVLAGKIESQVSQKFYVVVKKLYIFPNLLITFFNDFIKKLHFHLIIRLETHNLHFFKGENCVFKSLIL